MFDLVCWAAPMMLAANQAAEVYRQNEEDIADPAGATKRRRDREDRRLLLEQRAHEIAVARASAPIIHRHESPRYHDCSTPSSAAPFLLGMMAGETISAIGML